MEVYNVLVFLKCLPLFDLIMLDFFRYWIATWAKGGLRSLRIIDRSNHPIVNKSLRARVETLLRYLLVTILKIGLYLVRSRPWFPIFLQKTVNL